MDVLRSYLSEVQIPSDRSLIHKEECVYSYDNPESESGLYVCLKSFIGVGRRYLDLHSRKSGSHIYFHIKRIKLLKPKPEKPPEAPTEEITQLKIGVPGGFNPDSNNNDFTIEEHFSVVVYPNDLVFPYPSSELPEHIVKCVDAILKAESATTRQEAEIGSGTWDGEKLRVSKHATNLLQLDNGVKIKPYGWVCERCDLKDNLWLNLTDGSILCGRRFYDGSGGRNHALEHFQESKFPLAVKLGTITPNGADVFSYEEDDMVEDPHLGDHLAHFGIDILKMEKTDKTMLELEIDLNKQHEWSIIQESGHALTPLYGPGYTGMINLGNSCYMNSVMQVVFSIPDFQKKFVDKANEIFQNAPLDPSNDFRAQLAKLGSGLLSGEYSKPRAEGDGIMQSGIKPTTFKIIIGKDSHEFSSKRQQDAQEFFQHFLKLLERNSVQYPGQNPAECFKFREEERTQCLQSQRVRYRYIDQFSLRLPIPLEEATNKQEVEAYRQRKISVEAKGMKLDPGDFVRPRIPLKSCLAEFSGQRLVDDYKSAVTGQKTGATQKLSLATFPDYLMIQLEKFAVDSNWTVQKLDVAVDVPDKLDLAEIKGRGLQPGEEEMPEDDRPAAPAVQLDPDVIQTLMAMGYTENSVRRAIFKTNNQGLEAAMHWLLDHAGDPDFNDPLVIPGSSSAAVAVDPAALEQVMMFGFTRDKAVQALKSTDNNVERAVDWIFSHENDDTPANMDTSSGGENPRYRDGSPNYELCAFISHMGTSPMVGHYICHILRDGQWVIYNDEKVAVSEAPPKELGYLYLYRRVNL